MKINAKTGEIIDQRNDELRTAPAVQLSLSDAIAKVESQCISERCGARHRQRQSSL